MCGITKEGLQKKKHGTLNETECYIMKNGNRTNKREAFLLFYLQLKRLKKNVKIENIFLLSLFTVGLPAVFMCYPLTGWLPLNWYGTRMYNTLSQPHTHTHTHSSPKMWQAHEFSPCCFPVAETFCFPLSLSPCHVHTHISTSSTRGPVTGRVST